ncbi:MAG: hypothetical protein ACLTSZ_02625 [Lachnospiraceae bacterium]
MGLHEKTQGACRKLPSEISDRRVWSHPGKYFASLLYEGYSCENQTADKDYSNAKILGIDYAMQGMAVFSRRD